MNKPKNSYDPQELNALIREHGELVDLIIHQDTLGWQLRAGHLTVNATVLAITYILGAFSAGNPPLRLIGPVIFAAIFYNILSFFVFRRAKIRLSFQLLRAYEIEDKLEGGFGIPFRTLSSTERRMSEGYAIDERRPREIRRLRRFERFDVLDMGPWSIVIGLSWVFYLSWLLAGRPLLT